MKDGAASGVIAHAWVVYNRNVLIPDRPAEGVVSILQQNIVKLIAFVYIMIFEVNLKIVPTENILQYKLIILQVVAPKTTIALLFTHSQTGHLGTLFAETLANLQERVVSKLRQSIYKEASAFRDTVVIQNIYIIIILFILLL